jgi:hypothetical protein
MHTRGIYFNTVSSSFAHSMTRCRPYKWELCIQSGHKTGVSIRGTQGATMGTRDSAVLKRRLADESACRPKHTPGQGCHGIYGFLVRQELHEAEASVRTIELERDSNNFKLSNAASDE